MKKSWPPFLLLIVAIATRFLPLPPNFSPIGAIALFGGVYIGHKTLRFIVLLLILWISDIILNNFIYAEYTDGFSFFYQGSAWTYLSFAIIIFIGSLLKQKKQTAILLGASGAALVFFILSNFGVWLSTNMYIKNINGLLMCYTMAIPFFKNTLISNLLFSGLLFGAFELVIKKIAMPKSLQA